MTEPVNPKRSYDSPRRREQAAATRRDILAAAQRLFEQQGYAATTMAEIATEAGVALKTVYTAFETKSGVLRALWNLLLRGDERDVPVMDRAWYREVLDEPDPERQLRLNARNSRIVKVRVAALLEVIRQAAPLDPDIEALWSRIQSDFYDNQRAIVEIAGRASRRSAPGLDVSARDRHPLDAQPPRRRGSCSSAQRGWTPAQYEQWFARHRLRAAAGALAALATLRDATRSIAAPTVCA